MNISNTYSSCFKCKRYFIRGEPVKFEHKDGELVVFCSDCFESLPKPIRTKIKIEEE